MDDLSSPVCFGWQLACARNRRSSPLAGEADAFSLTHGDWFAVSTAGWPQSAGARHVRLAETSVAYGRVPTGRRPYVMNTAGQGANGAGLRRGFADGSGWLAVRFSWARIVVSEGEQVLASDSGRVPMAWVMTAWIAGSCWFMEPLRVRGEVDDDLAPVGGVGATSREPAELLAHDPGGPDLLVQCRFVGHRDQPDLPGPPGAPAPPGAARGPPAAADLLRRPPLHVAEDRPGVVRGLQERWQERQRVHALDGRVDLVRQVGVQSLGDLVVVVGPPAAAPCFAGPPLQAGRLRRALDLVVRDQVPDVAGSGVPSAFSGRDSLLVDISRSTATSLRLLPWSSRSFLRASPMPRGGPKRGPSP